MWTIQYHENQMVGRHSGTLPVLLTCPHGGSAKPPGVTKRKGGTSGCPPLNILRDDFTTEITTGVAQLVLETLGEAPHVVIARFHRKYIDANRSPKCAFEKPAAKPFYDAYHRAIRASVDEIIAENGPSGFLFDIHGVKTIPEDPAAVYLGTDNGDSVTRLLESDPLAMFRRRSLRGLLQAAGYTVSPAVPGIPETAQVNGGFTTATYGSNHADGIDAIQIEIAHPIRQDEERRGEFIEHLGRAIASIVARAF